MPSEIDIQTRQGIEHAQAGDSEHAIHCFRLALELAPDQPFDLLSHLGNELLKARHHIEAEGVFEALSVQYPDKPHGLVGCARTALAMKEWETALGLWEECLKRFPGKAKPDWQKHRANALIKLGRLEEANIVFEALDQAYPDRPLGCVGMAMTATKMKLWETALARWNLCFDRFRDQAKPWWYDKRKLALVAMGEIHSALEVEREQHSSTTAQAYFDMIDANRLQRSEQPPTLKFKSLLLVTYGRSGSTLLQGLVNTIDGVVVRGENMNIFHDFFKIHTTLADAKRRYMGAILPNHPWYGIGLFDEARILAHFSETARSLLLADRADDLNVTCYGFKEIRYTEVGDRLSEYLDFLSTIFPEPAFVFNTRNLDKVVNSAWWKERDPEAVRKELTELEEKFETYTVGRENCFQISYEEVVAKGDRLRALFDFLGAPYHQNRIETVLSVPHSYNPTSQDIKQASDQF